MSSPPCKPGHGAPAAPVSSSSGNQAGDAGAEAAGGFLSTTAAAAPLTANPTLPKSDAPPPTASEEATGPAQVHLPSVPLVPPAPSPQAPLPRAPTANHADPYNKYPRAPALPQRSHGPSLLTQALATARGIVPPNQPDTAQNSKKPSSTKTQDPPPAPPPPKARREEHSHLADEAVHSPRDDALRPGDGDSLTPRASSRASSFAASATDPTPTTTPSTAKAMATTTTYNMLDYREMSSVLRGHREFLGSRGKERGTSLERTDQERRAQERPSRSGTFSHGTRDTIALVSPRFVDSAALLDDTPSEGGEVQAPSQLMKADKLVALGPSQAWSIGATESNSGEDGQVEKSITEALTGREPNARSRKASHSLRFFREGLPDDKGKRKDSRTASQLRDKAFASDVFSGDAEGPAPEQAPPDLDDKDLPTPGRLPPSRTIPGSSDPYRISESPEDYFLLNRGDVRSGDAHESLSELQLPDPALRVSDVETAAAQVPQSGQWSNRNVQDGANEPRASADEAEDSGEEKISSAVFLPHQGLEPSPELAPTSGVAPPRATAGSRTLSRAEDFHPWLVKADEPEASDGDRDTVEVRPDDQKIAVISTDVKPQLDDAAVVDEEIKFAGSIPQHYEDHVHEHQLVPSKPLDAIELIPYKHQVGGHTTLWRFSKRAVCKQLNNRENEFYEKIERYHRDLLAFLPRYIGVLNVTFKKQPRRRSTVKREDSATQERKQIDQGELANAVKSHENLGQGDVPPTPVDTNKAINSGHTRVISQSLQSAQIPVPTVTFVDNQHILPRNLLQPSQNGASLSGRLRSTSASMSDMQLSSRSSGLDLMRPSLEDRHANSWGATTVNKKLRNEVFNDAFLKRGPIVIQRHRKGHHRPLPRRLLPSVLRPAISEPNLIDPQEADGHASDGAVLPRQRRHMLEQTQSDVGQLSLSCDEPDVKDVTGTSAPEPEIMGEPLSQEKRKRRHSGSALRRKPTDVQESRGDLQLFEEADDAGYKGDNEELDRKLVPSGISHERHTTSPDLFLKQRAAPGVLALSTIPSAATSGAPSPTAEFKKIPRPINPKEAQTQRDSRVEYFLLLEDLTAGMKRPCIMDLKMGTRQYGVDANPKKQKSQQGKCAKTTSRELGVRVCGLQVWDVETQSYVFRDKYYGRDIKAGAEFQEALTRFLYDGVDYSSVLRHIPTILKKLSQLEVIIGRLNGYRFYAASLLMFYDGDTSETEHDTLIDDSTTDFATDTEEAPRRQRRNKQEIDFKMADFANCITPHDDMTDKACPPAHPDEPDRGFLRGLRTLKKYFLKIQRDVRDELGLVSHSQLRNGDGSDYSEIKEDEGEVSV